MDYSMFRYSDIELKKLIESIPPEVQMLDGIWTIDMKTLSEDFFRANNVADMSIDPNGNVNEKTVVNYDAETKKPSKKMLGYDLYFKTLKEIYGPEIAKDAIQSVLNGTIYIHDMQMYQSPYCFAWSTSFILHEGLPWVSVKPAPPKRLDSFLDQVRHVMMKMGAEFAGALAPGDILANAAYFTKNMSDKEIQNNLERFVYFLNTEWRTNGDSLFSNIAIFDMILLQNVFKDAIYPDFSKVIDNIYEIMRVQRIFAKLMADGCIPTGLPFNYPICTINLSLKSGKIQDKVFFHEMAELNRERGIFNWHSGSRHSMCCRLEQNLSDLKKTVQFDSFGNGGIRIGSGKVVTLNIHRIALLSKALDKPMLELIPEYMKLMEAILITHREIMKLRVSQRFYTFFNNKYCDLTCLFATFGFTGLYDSYIVENKYNTNDYVEYCREIIGCLNTFIAEADKRHPDIAFNLEHPPVEGAASVLAAKDRYYFGGDCELLSNQILPLNQPFDIAERLDVSQRIGDIISGGNMLHINIDQDMTQGAHDDMLKLCLEKYGITHMALNKYFLICSNGHMVNDKKTEICSICGEYAIDKITRVVGYFSKVSNWSPKRREVDFPNRQWYDGDGLS